MSQKYHSNSKEKFIGHYTDQKVQVCVPPTRARGLSRFITIVRWLELAHDDENPSTMVFHGGLGVLIT